MTTTWAGTRFDGRSAAGAIVLVRVEGDALVVASRTAMERIALRDVAVSEPFERAPRMLELPHGHTLELRDPMRTFPAALERAGVRMSWIVRMQRAWAAVAIALLLTVAGGAWIYVSGLPIAARVVAEALPPAFERRIGENLLALLDENSLEPSELSAEEQQRIRERFREVAARAAPGVETRLEFRSGMVNAFALPGGTIVLFDELVDLAEDDDGVLGVLGHELGHVVHRHSMRQLAQALGLAAIAGVVWGDFSSLASNAPLLLGVMRYGREFEIEADDFAIAALRASGISPRVLHDFFVEMEKSSKRKSRTGIPEFLSTHPDVGSRIERLREASEAFERGAPYEGRGLR